MEKGNTFKRNEIITLVHEKTGANRSSIIPSDYCYNRRNRGIKFPQMCLFERLETGNYKYLGPNYSYSGPVYFRERGMREDRIDGEWKNGIYYEG